MLDDLDGCFAVSADVQVSSLLAKEMGGAKGRPAHLFVTDLANPKQAFYDRVGAKASPSPELLARFEVGNVMHFRFARAIESVESVHANEAPMDGALVDLAGIRGRLDHCVDRSLLEFKTSPYDMETPEEVWSRAPQYVAQLLIYAAIWTASERDHILAIMTVNGSTPGAIRAFRVRIQDLRLLRERVAALRDKIFQCLDDENPEGLGSCAFAGNHCQFQDAGTCDCDGSAPLIRDWLGQGVEMTRDPEFEAKLDEAWSNQQEARGVIPWELQVPRQRLVYDLHGEDWLDSGGVDPTAHSRKLLREAIQRSGLLAPRSETDDLKTPAEPALSIGFRWLKVPKTKGRGLAHNLSPALLRQWTKDREPTAQDYSVRNHARQAAAVAAFWNRTDAYILYHCPDTEHHVRAFKVSLTKLGGARDLTVRRVHEMRKAVEAGHGDKLPECPTFVAEKCALANCLCT